MSDSATGIFCAGQTETIVHLFASCNNVQEFWQNINSWLSWVSKFKILFYKQEHSESADLRQGSTYPEIFIKNPSITF